ncbi:hypothetical protein lerEdw1_007213 [Lerista edwardsae]|nr:hypothetical protein lerEdw1_007213 [Lerista edwardsae]
MNASETQQDSDCSGKNVGCREARFTKENIVTDKPAGIVDHGEEGRVSSEECLLTLTHFDGSLERTCTKEQNGSPKGPLVKTRDRKVEKLHSRESCLEARPAGKGIFLEARMSAFELAETILGFNRGRSEEKGLVLDTAFSGQLLESQKKDSCRRILGPLIPEAKDDQEDAFRCVVGGTKTEKAKCKEETVFESMQKLHKNKNTTTNVIIKPCYVLLKDISLELKEKHECCLIQPNVKKQKMQSKRKTDVIKKPKVILHDIMKKCNIERLKKPLQMQNVETLLDDAKENQREDSMEPNNFAAALCSGGTDSGETNADYDGKKENKASSPGNATFCDMGIFEKLAAMELNNVDSFMGLDDIQENVKGKGSFWVNSVLFPKAQKTFVSEARFSKVSLSRMGASFSLPDEADLCEAACELESGFASLRSGEDLKLDVKGTVPSKTQIKVPIEPGSTNLLTEGGIQNQVEKLNQSNPVFSNASEDSCWFLVNMDEVVDVADPACVTNEDSLSREPDYGDVPLSHGVGLPQLEGESDCGSYRDGAADMKYMIKKGTVVSGHSEACDGEVGSSEESGSPQLAGPVGPWLQELRELTVKLLGSPSNNHAVPSLGRIIDLVDVSSDEASQGNNAGQSANSRKEGKIDPVGTDQSKPSSLGDGRAQKRRNRAAPPANRPRLSQSQNRAKVIDALRETLQKRLDDSPELRMEDRTLLQVAERVERALFELFCCVDQHYKNKYRSLLFNLKSPDNQLLFRRVVLGDITPERLVQMTSLEMAPKELAEWRASKNKRVLEIIEREEQDAQRGCPTKFTHKGIIEIHREVDEDLALQETLGPQPLDSSCEAPAASGRKPSVNHPPHPGDSDCAAGAEQAPVDSERGFMPRHLKQKENVSKRSHSSSLRLDGEKRRLSEDSIPKKHPRMEEQSKSTVVWKGLIQMFSLKQFAAEAYPVSGSSSRLSQALPFLLRSRGCILPEDVWVYLDSMWPANSKAMGIIRFCPRSARDPSPYNMLYSYLNNKQRYGIVDTSQVEMFMVPLAAFQPMPSKLHPLGGPGLDLHHPSLLLGLILPKGAPAGILVTRPNPLPKAKRKRVTFKDGEETRLPPRLPVASSPAQPPGPRATPGLLREDEGPPEPLTAGDLLTVPEGLAGAMCPPGPCEGAADGHVLSHLGGLLQALSGSPWIGGQLGGLPLGPGGAQPLQARDWGQAGVDSGPSYPWSVFGLPLPTCPNQWGTEESSLLETLLVADQLGAEAGPPPATPAASWVSQVPCTGPVAEAPSSLLAETLALLQQVAQLQPHPQGQPPAPAALGLPTAPPEVGSALPQAAAGRGLPPAPQENGLCAQLQLLVSALGGQAQPPSAF